MSEASAVVYEILTPRLRLSAPNPRLTDELHEVRPGTSQFNNEDKLLKEDFEHR